MGRGRPWPSIRTLYRPVGQFPALSQTPALVAAVWASAAAAVREGCPPAPPGSPSLAVQVAVTGLVHHPAPSNVASGARSGVPVTVGDVVSRGAVKRVPSEGSDVPRALVAVTVKVYV